MDTGTKAIAEVTTRRAPGIKAEVSTAANAVTQTGENTVGEGLAGATPMAEEDDIDSGATMTMIPAEIVRAGGDNTPTRTSIAGAAAGGGKLCGIISARSGQSDLLA